MELGYLLPPHDTVANDLQPKSLDFILHSAIVDSVPEHTMNSIPADTTAMSA